MLRYLLSHILFNIDVSELLNKNSILIIKELLSWYFYLSKAHMILYIQILIYG